MAKNLFGDVGLQLDVVVIDGHVIQILQNQCIAVFETPRQHTAEKKAEFFKLSAEMGGSRIGKIYIQMDNLDFF
ncbi:MAG: hypothetical protein ACYSR9_15210 [Planctomycetota bacterium]